MAKIVLVDDDLFIQDFIASKLIAAGHKVTGVTDGDDALASISAARPDVVLLDLDIPHRGGRTILSDLRAVPELAEVPVIIFSNSDDPKLQDELTKLGASGFFLKAMTSPKDLIAQLDALHIG